MRDSDTYFTELLQWIIVWYLEIKVSFHMFLFYDGGETVIVSTLINNPAMYVLLHPHCKNETLRLRGLRFLIWDLTIGNQNLFDSKSYT